SDDTTDLSVTVGGDLAVTPTLTGGCDDTVSFDATAAGSSGATSFAWTFTDAAGHVVHTATGAAGSFAAGDTGAVDATVTRTETRPDGVRCDTSASASVTVYPALAAAITTSPS